MLYLKTFFRSLSRNRIHTTVTLIGFSLSLAVVILLSAYIKSEESINRHYPNVERTYLMIKNDQSAFMPESILEKLRKESPGIEDATMWTGNTAEFGDKYIKGTYLSIDESFLNIFSVKLLKGNMEGIKLKDHVFITTDFAKKIVGDKDPIGEKINWNTSTLTIVGLIESCGKKSGFLYDIRRVNGASMTDIMFMLNKKFLMPVFIAFILACPIAYLILIQWLENFSYKAEMSWWIFALAGLITMVISLLTISWQSLKAAMNNPIESFK